MAEDIMKAVGAILGLAGVVEGILAAIGAFALAGYFILWALAYPTLGHYCAIENTVQSTKLTANHWYGDAYTTTFKDGSQATTSYVKPGETYCIDHEAHFWPWDWK